MSYLYIDGLRVGSFGMLRFPNQSPGHSVLIELIGCDFSLLAGDNISHMETRHDNGDTFRFTSCTVMRVVKGDYTFNITIDVTDIHKVGRDGKLEIIRTSFASPAKMKKKKEKKRPSNIRSLVIFKGR